MCVTILFFQVIISLLGTNFICRMDKIYNHLIYIYYTLSSIYFHRIHVFMMFQWSASLFLSKKIVKYNSEIHSFLHPADAFHPCKLISRYRPGFFYLKPIVPIKVLGKLFKDISFSTQSKYGDDLIYFKSVSVRQKNGRIFKFIFMYRNKYMYLQYIAIYMVLLPRIYGFSYIMCPCYSNFKEILDVTWEVLGKQSPCI